MLFAQGIFAMLQVLAAWQVPFVLDDIPFDILFDGGSRNRVALELFSVPGIRVGIERMFS